MFCDLPDHSLSQNIVGKNSHSCVLLSELFQFFSRLSLSEELNTHINSIIKNIHLAALNELMQEESKFMTSLGYQEDPISMDSPTNSNQPDKTQHTLF